MTDRSLGDDSREDIYLDDDDTDSDDDDNNNGHDVINDHHDVNVVSSTSFCTSIQRITGELYRLGG